MNRPYSNKYAQAGAYILAITLFGFGIYTGLTMADPGTGSFAGINFSPKQVTFAGLSLGTIWVVIRSLAGSNFKDYEMPKPIIILWCVLLFGGALVFGTLRLPSEHRVSSGMAIFLSGAILPLLLYVGLGVAINKANRRRQQ